jgi:AraC-like DNA-binding protein
MLNSTVMGFTDPWEWQESVRGSDMKVLVTARGKYQASLTGIDLHRLRLQRAEISLPQITVVATKGDRIPLYFLAGANQLPIYQDGQELPPGVIVFNSSPAEHYRRMPADNRWGSISVTPDDLAATGRSLIGHELVAPAATQLVRPPPALMSRLLRVHEAAGRLAATAPDFLAYPEVSRVFEQELLLIMVRCLTEGMTTGTDSSHGRARLPVMRRFEQFLDDNPDRPIYMAEVCAAIGASGRTLRQHCQEQLGMTPHQYLWLRRMNFARRALAAADPATATVTGIALDNGFWELGRFAVQYRRLFGESPSVTLRHAQ